ncbi:MAG: sulfurtransferase TusA family protein [Clostridiales bacterium]|jgi:TusA-related sulfurtransferase|nr:sulfurtransferase TusA family protein [Clostridiales bacterium]
MRTIDACGISCPEPLLMLKKALQSESELMLLLDGKGALGNCEEYAKKQGFDVETTIEGDMFKLHIARAHE